MYQPLPVLDYSFNMLPWRRRLRTCLSRIDLDKVQDPIFSKMDTGNIRAELDKELDQSFWTPNQEDAYRGLQQRIQAYTELLRKSANEVTRNHYHVKLTLLRMAMDKAFAGIQYLYQIPRWKNYMLQLTKEKSNEPWQVTFTAENDNQAFDWLLQAVMSQEEELFKEFKWSVWHLYHLPYNNPNKKIEITEAFWDWAGPLAQDPLKQF